MKTRLGTSATTLILVLALGTLLVFFWLAFGGSQLHPLLVSMLIALIIVTAFLLISGMWRRGAAKSRQLEARPPASPVPWADLQAETEGVFTPRAEHVVGDAVVVEGDLLADADTVYSALKKRLAASGLVPLLQEDERGRPSLVLLPRTLLQPRSATSRPLLNLALLVATLLTTTWAGAMQQGVDLLHEPARFAVGLPYSLALLVILGSHELGHYFTARSYGMNVSLPYFIPVPFALGTFGAFISMRSPSETRRALFDVAVAGPLVGLVFAIPALFIGLQYSQIVPAPTGGPGLFQSGVNVDSSALLAMISEFAMTRRPGVDEVLMLHPLAFAGWLGLFITALNLMPIGQLDGGHMADAMFGLRASTALGMISIATLVILGLFVWSGLLIWAFIAYFIAGRKGLTALNDLTRLHWLRLAIGWFAFLLLLAILLPVPHGFFDKLCVHCPYL